jgi:hypothetical protein
MTQVIDGIQTIEPQAYEIALDSIYGEQRTHEHQQNSSQDSGDYRTIPVYVQVDPDE